MFTVSLEFTSIHESNRFKSRPESSYSLTPLSVLEITLELGGFQYITITIIHHYKANLLNILYEIIQLCHSIIFTWLLSEAFTKSF